jgi:hypothetical protein
MFESKFEKTPVTVCNNVLSAKKEQIIYVLLSGFLTFKANKIHFHFQAVITNQEKIALGGGHFCSCIRLSVYDLID